MRSGYIWNLVKDVNAGKHYGSGNLGGDDPLVRMSIKWSRQELQVMDILDLGLDVDVWYQNNVGP